MPQRYEKEVVDVGAWYRSHMNTSATATAAEGVSPNNNTAAVAAAAATAAASNATNSQQQQQQHSQGGGHSVGPCLVQ